MYSVKNGMNGAIAFVVVNNTSYRVFNGESGSLDDVLNRLRFKRTYQLVSCSMKVTNLGSTVYNLYASISVLMNFTRVWVDAKIHLSIMDGELTAFWKSGTNLV